MPAMSSSSDRRVRAGARRAMERHGERGAPRRGSAAARRSAGDSRGSAMPSSRSRVKTSSSCFARPIATSRSRPSSAQRRRRPPSAGPCRRRRRSGRETARPARARGGTGAAPPRASRRSRPARASRRPRAESRELAGTRFAASGRRRPRPCDATVSRALQRRDVEALDAARQRRAARARAPQRVERLEGRRRAVGEVRLIRHRPRCAPPGRAARACSPRFGTTSRTRRPAARRRARPRCASRSSASRSTGTCTSAGGCAVRVELLRAPRSATPRSSGSATATPGRPRAARSVTSSMRSTTRPRRIWNTCDDAARRRRP